MLLVEKNNSFFDLQELPDNHISRLNIIKWLYERLNNDRKVINVKGSDGSGKTTLFNEFARTYNDQCFIFFIGADHWSSSSYLFLSEMIDQMSTALNIENKITDKNPSFEQLNQEFTLLYRRIAQLARKTNKPFIFIVDGLENVQKIVGEKSIIELLPFDPPQGLFLLTSSTNEFEIPNKHTKFESYSIQYFSQAESEQYLQDLPIPKDKLFEIYRSCDGLPGYLAELRREINSGIALDEVLFQLPKGFKNLLDRSWERVINEADDNILDLLAIFCFSDMQLSIAQLQELSGINFESLLENLSSIDFIQIDPLTNLFTFVSNAHRKYLIDRLENRRKKIESLLINYLETKPFEKVSVQYLPMLYRRANQYDSLKKLIDTDYIIQTLETERDLDLLIKNSKIVAEIAYEQHDWKTLNKYSLICSLLNTISSRGVGEGEVDALLALNRHDDAFKHAYQVILPEDRLELLAKICYDLKKKDIEIPTDILTDLEHLSEEVKPTSTTKERIIEIAANLFYVHEKAALVLVNNTRTAIDGKVMDVILAVLSIKLIDQPDSADKLRSMIVNESTRDLTHVASPIIAKLDTQTVINHIKDKEDVSAKLFILRSWCNSNRTNPEAITVIKTAIDIMTSSTEYSPSMRHLRQFAEPLIVCEDKNITDVIARIDILKNTSIDKPADEKVRLELILSICENFTQSESGISRFYETYYGIDEIKDLDVKCYCLARFLVSIPEILPEDLNIIPEIENRLEYEFQDLLDNSADQYHITKRIIKAITTINPNLATKFANKLNTQLNRDKAFYDILNVYADQFYENIDYDFLYNIIDSFSEKEKKDWAVVIILRKLAEKASIGCITENCRLVADIENFYDEIDKILAYAFMIKLFSLHGKSKEVNEIQNLLLNAWGKIDELWIQIDVGFNIISILENHTPEFSNEFFQKIIGIQEKTPLTSESFVEGYINTIVLSIRTLPDILKSKEYNEYINNLFVHIAQIPSFSMQTILYSKIGLVLYLEGKQSDADKLVKEKVLTGLDQIINVETRSKTVVSISPLLYEYERKIHEDEVNQLSQSKKDGSLMRVIHYLISKRSPDDPIDFDNIKTELDNKILLQVCDVINQLQTDTMIFSSIALLIQVMLKKEKAGKNINEVCKHPEKISLRISKELLTIINKLPDNNNIKHDGYKLTCLSCLVRLRAAVNRKKVRAESDWMTIAPTSSDLYDAANNIQNTADKAFVLSIIGQLIYFDNPKLAIRMLEESKKNTYLINNVTDRVQRLITLAEAWKKIEDTNSSKIFLQEAFSIANSLDWDSTRDETTGRILELAHSIDSEFAASLTSSIDSPIVKERNEQTKTIHELQNKPNDILTKQDEAIVDVLDTAANYLLRSFCSGRGYAQDPKVVCEWLKYCTNTDLENAYNIFAWSIENDLASHKSISIPQLDGLFDSINDTLFLLLKLGQTILPISRPTMFYQSTLGMGRSNLQLFNADTDQKRTVLRWLGENSGETVKIYDAYFGPSDLEILKAIPSTSRVDIFTLWISQRGVDVGDKEIEKLFKTKWEELSDQEPPETHIYIIGVASNGSGPIHDRYVISDKIGIQIGTSISGLDKKDSGIYFLSEEDVTELLNKYIYPLMLGNIRVYKGEKLETYNFTL